MVNGTLKNPHIYQKEGALVLLSGLVSRAGAQQTGVLTLLIVPFPLGQNCSRKMAMTMNMNMTGTG